VEYICSFLAKQFQLTARICITLVFKKYLQIFNFPLLTQAKDLMLILKNFKLKQIINVSKDTHNERFLNSFHGLESGLWRMLRRQNSSFIIPFGANDAKNTLMSLFFHLYVTSQTKSKKHPLNVLLSNFFSSYFVKKKNLMAYLFSILRQLTSG
jgi:hypothetical protein